MSVLDKVVHVIFHNESTNCLMYVKVLVVLQISETLKLLHVLFCLSEWLTPNGSQPNPSTVRCKNVSSLSPRSQIIRLYGMQNH